MKNSPPLFKIPFDDLHTLFSTGEEETFYTQPCNGKGLVHLFKLEKGLHARIWDCCFNKGMEMYYTAEVECRQPYFTIAYFLKMQGLQFANGDVILQENHVWDTLFISSTSCLRMYVPPMAQTQCLSISFTKDWLLQNLSKGKNENKDLLKKIDSPETFALIEYMNDSEKRQVQELVGNSLKKSTGSFYLKSTILKIISDFFTKIRERESLSINNHKQAVLINEAEKLLCSYSNRTMPCLKELSCKYDLSESTIKRYFKKRHGTTMYNYFINKKMEHAQQLMDEKDMNTVQAARLLGYTNMNHFVKMFNKYTGKT
jgi:AraC-like DNA-binding protein